MLNIKQKILTKRLVLRPLDKGDFYAWQQNRLTRLSPNGKFDIGPKSEKECTAGEFKKKLAFFYQTQAKQDKMYVLCVFLRSSGEMIGQIDLLTVCRRDRQVANLGYAIHNQFWAKGSGKEAALGGIQFAFLYLGFHRLEAITDRGNLRSIRLAKAIGMKPEDLKRKYLFENGKWIDQLMYSVIPENIGMKAKHPTL